MKCHNGAVKIDILGEVCICHASSLTLMLIESKYAINCHHSVLLHTYNRYKLFTVFRRCITFDEVYNSEIRVEIV